MHGALIHTSDGTFTAHFTAQGLARLDFPGSSSLEQPEPAPAHVQPWLAQTRLALEQALLGRRPSTLPPLDLSAGSAFQQSIWRALLTIGPGETLSYTALAKAVGRPGAARAAGQACGANPIPVLVPCHRVLAAHGALGGFSGGLTWKKTLLRREGNLSGATLDSVPVGEQRARTAAMAAAGGTHGRRGF